MFSRNPHDPPPPARLRFCLLAGGLLLLSSFSPPANAQSEAAREFFDAQLLVDGTCFPYYRPGSEFHRFHRRPDGKFDMAEYVRETGVDLAVWDIRRREEMLKMIRGVELGHFVNVRVIRSFSDIEAAFRAGEHSWLFHTQHPWPLRGSVAPMEDWHRDGLRMLQIVYGSSIPVEEEEKLGTGSSSGDDETSGLTTLGRQVVGECNRLGIIVDVSHANRQTTLEVAKSSRAPIVATHAGCEAVTPAKRNKSDEEIRAIAETGGLFGVCPIRFMLTDREKGASIDDFIQHLEHAIEVAGIDHVGIASDIKRNGVPEEETVAWTCPELNGEKRWLHLYDALAERGYSREDRMKIFGRNYLRVFREVLK